MTRLASVKARGVRGGTNVESSSKDNGPAPKPRGKTQRWLSKCHGRSGQRPSHGSGSCVRGADDVMYGRQVGGDAEMPIIITLLYRGPSSAHHGLSGEAANGKILLALPLASRRTSCRIDRRIDHSPPTTRPRSARSRRVSSTRRRSSRLVHAAFVWRGNCHSSLSSSTPYFDCCATTSMSRYES